MVGIVLIKDNSCDDVAVSDLPEKIRKVYKIIAARLTIVPSKKNLCYKMQTIRNTINKMLVNGDLQP